MFENIPETQELARSTDHQRLAVQAFSTWWKLQVKQRPPILLQMFAKSRAPEFEAEVQISPFFLPFSNMEKTTKLHALNIPRIVSISHRMLGFATALLSPPVKANSRSGWSSSSSDLNDAKSYQITQWKLMQLNQIDLPLKRWSQAVLKLLYHLID